MARGSQTNEIGIVLYPGAQLAAVHGLTDLFGIASKIASQSRQNGATRLIITHWAPAKGDIACVYSSEPSATQQPGTLIIPPTLVDLPDPDICASIGQWLLSQHARGAGLVTVCSGVFLLARTGLLDGRLVSTHRSCARMLIECLPNIAVDAEERLVEHADILTAGGFMAWIDVGLILIERLLGDDVRAETARFVLSGHSPRETERASGWLPPQSHNDIAVKRAQELVHMRDGQGITLAAMAAAAKLERRTFLRRFTNATGMTPIEYCRAVRLARAREILEAGNMPLKQIAETLGYMDVSSFARAFRRAHGVSPGIYRRQHGGAISGYAATEAAT